MLWREISFRTWLFGLVLIGALGAAFYLVLGRGAKLSSIGQLERLQTTIARAESGNIRSFFQLFGGSVAVLARSSSIERRDAKTLRDMDMFVEQWRDSGKVSGVVLTDERGVVEFSSSTLGKPDTGAILTDRDYFLWANNHPEEGQYFIGQPVISRLGVSKGNLIVPVASPVYRDEVFVGVVAAAVNLQPLTQSYFGMAKASDQASMYLIDGSRRLLYSNSTSDTVGSSYLQSSLSRLFSSDENLSTNLENAITSGVEGSLRIEKYIIAYSPVLMDTQNWLLILVSSAGEVDNLTAPIYIRQAAILLLSIITIILFGIVAIRSRR